MLDLDVSRGGHVAASSPGPSDLREALAQPSRLAQQEQQLLAKQRVVPLIRATAAAAAAAIESFARQSGWDNIECR